MVLLSVHKFARSPTDRSNLVIAMTIQKSRRHRRKRAELPDDIQLLVKAATASDNDMIDRDDSKDESCDKEDGENESPDGDDGEDENSDGDD